MKRFLCVLGLAAVLGGCSKPELLERAERGDVEAQFALGELRWDGTEDLAKDRAEAFQWYRKAAEQGYAEAQNNLGLAYFYGEGVTKDYAEAVKWLRKAVEQGYADAIEALKKLGVKP